MPRSGPRTVRRYSDEFKCDASDREEAPDCCRRAMCASRSLRVKRAYRGEPSRTFARAFDGGADLEVQCANPIFLTRAAKRGSGCRLSSAGSCLSWNNIQSRSVNALSNSANAAPWFPKAAWIAPNV